MEIITKSTQETFKLGEEIGTSLKQGEVIALIGEMGAGKTTFMQGFARGLKIKNKIQSPTFILMRSYKGRLKLFHLDLYRLEENVEKEVRDLGLFDIWQKKDNIVAIEWAEKIQNILPKETKYIKFEYLEDDERKIIIE
jgi:tRNA threonylcarbamoyladenosine biosynthesis protein TsaE